ncbi:MAG: ARMT1-like domain-containing protein [Chloroflexota bacterium]|nr:ARMT1-like domain-containing protein [Chloroflexota bacterium]
MKVSQVCYDCLKKLIYQAAQLATPDILLRQRAIENGIEVLDNKFSYNQISVVIATKIHEVIKEVTINPDPYQAMKAKEMEVAKELYPEISLQYKGSFRDYLRLAAAANAIDFFKELDGVVEDIRKPIDFTIDDSCYLEGKLRDGGKVLYLADNAGEVYFDLALLSYMRRFADTIYVVKPSPVQNDATLEDVRNSGLESKFGKIITTGIASPGIIISLASEEFKHEFESAELIFAKGMGYYESLSDLPSKGRVFYCLKAKCNPVADSLGVPLDSYVAMLR